MAAVLATDDIALRTAEEADEAAIAALHAVSWRTAYRGMIPDAYLDDEAVDDLSRTWAERFTDRSGTLTIVATAGDDIVGFAHSVIDDDPEWGTLLDNLHVAPGLRRSGVGRRLVLETARRLVDLATSPDLHLWVLEPNLRARAFYDALGGRVTGSDVSPEIPGSVPCVRYSWELADLAARPA